MKLLLKNYGKNRKGTIPFQQHGTVHVPFLFFVVIF